MSRIFGGSKLASSSSHWNIRRLVFFLGLDICEKLLLFGVPATLLFWFDEPAGEFVHDENDVEFGSCFLGDVIDSVSRRLTVVGLLKGFLKSVGRFLVGDGSVRLLRHFRGDSSSTSVGFVVDFSFQLPNGLGIILAVECV